MIDRLVKSIVWVVFTAIVSLAVWTLIDPTSDPEKKFNLFKFLALVWTGIFAVLSILPAINNYRYGDRVKPTPVTQVLKQAAFRALLFTAILNLYLIIRVGPHLT